MTSDCSTSCTCKPRRLPPTSSYRPSYVARQAQIERPQGQPGTYRGRDGNPQDVILDTGGLLWVHAHTGSMTDWLWVPMRGWDVDHFESDPDVPEWVPECTHDRICDTETACTALTIEQGDGSW